MSTTEYQTNVGIRAMLDYARRFVDGMSTTTQQDVWESLGASTLATRLVDQYEAGSFDPFEPDDAHILIDGDTGPTLVNAEGMDRIVLNVPLVKPLDLADGRHVVSIGLDADALIAIAAVMEEYETRIEAVE